MLWVDRIFNWVFGVFNPPPKRDAYIISIRCWNSKCQSNLSTRESQSTKEIDPYGGSWRYLVSTPSEILEVTSNEGFPYMLEISDEEKTREKINDRVVYCPYCGKPNWLAQDSFSEIHGIVFNLDLPINKRRILRRIKKWGIKVKTILLHGYQHCEKEQSKNKVGVWKRIWNWIWNWIQKRRSEFNRSRISPNNAN